jgi:hypothetical protein
VQLGAQEWLQKRIGPGQLMWVCSSYWIVCMFGALSIVCEVGVDALRSRQPLGRTGGIRACGMILFRAVWRYLDGSGHSPRGRS